MKADGFMNTNKNDFVKVTTMSISRKTKTVELVLELFAEKNMLYQLLI